MSRNRGRAVARLLLPTAERFRHGQVIRIDEPIRDSEGALVRPYKGLDTLERMERAGTIDARERRAGDKFHDIFRRAHLDDLRAADPTRVPVMLANGKAGCFVEGNQAARLAVLSALDALGGIQSTTGSCAWHVLGCEMPLVAWALWVSRGGRRVSKLMASGILLSDLQILRGHFGC
jgi:hypothetical protein